MSFGDQFEIVQTQISHSLFSKYEAVDYMGWEHTCPLVKFLIQQRLQNFWGHTKKVVAGEFLGSSHATGNVIFWCFFPLLLPKLFSKQPCWLFKKYMNYYLKMKIKLKMNGLDGTWMEEKECVAKEEWSGKPKRMKLASSCGTTKC